jgi:hypothetical protein
MFLLRAVKRRVDQAQPFVLTKCGDVRGPDGRPVTTTGLR